MNNLRQFESVVDAAFGAHPLPHPNGHVSIWYLLTVAEDSQRLMMALPDEHAPQWQVEYTLDRFKFSLRSCLARVRKEVKDWTATALPKKVIPLLYARTHILLLAGVDYSLASQVCSSAHNGSVRVIERDGRYRVEIVEDYLDKRYGMLEVLRQSSKQPIVSFAILFWLWIRDEQACPGVIWQIAAAARVRGRRIVYEYDPILAYALARVMPQQPMLIPDEWTFPWGGRHETTLLLNSLSVRLLYHLIAVHYGAGTNGLKGGAEHDLCLILSRETWVSDLEEMSSLEPAKIEAFVDQLTFGNQSRSPDQALQPFVPMGAQGLGVGPLGWLSSNLERNLLSLQARVAVKEFSRQSGLFERQMTDSLATTLRERWQHCVANRTFTMLDGKEEIDILICEPETKTVAVLELRWMLPPADPREVQEKKDACLQKVQQVRRKAAAVAKAVDVVLHTAFGIDDIVVDTWTVGAVAVIEGFGGTRSPDVNIPVVPEWLLEAGVKATPTLSRLLEWAVGLEWLPMEGRDFQVIEGEPHLERTFDYPGLIPLRNGLSYLGDAIGGLRESSDTTSVR
ncbi:hypothetical protein [Burkholderia sp. A1]|uniref:hypothetical protein n=1 Tax=Burkholderia sp. A1 TaxID=148446 RepID=UPI000ADB1755|nr:hypothetical protein [Burkholderia sp. A1]